MAIEKIGTNWVYDTWWGFDHMGITKQAYPIFRYTDIVDRIAIGNLRVSVAYLG